MDATRVGRNESLPLAKVLDWAHSFCYEHSGKDDPNGSF